MPVFRADRADLYYEVHGTGPAILGIHGTPSSALLWTDAASELATVGRCIIYDRRGFFRSALPWAVTTLNLDDHVADAVALLEGPRRLTRRNRRSQHRWADRPGTGLSSLRGSNAQPNEPRGNGRAGWSGP